ncbi:MAG: signal peptide peptidase SppA [Rhabdaerophilum calidifontis]
MAMHASADLIVDRRRLRRQVTFWRVLAILVLVGAIIAAGLVFGRGGLGGAQPHIARIRIEGLITGSQTTFDLLRRTEESGARAVILRINSGGGTTAGSEALYNEVRRLAQKKPVVAVIEGIGASGAYMTALGAERIFANGSALVGSIGVIAQIPNVAKLLETLGVKVEAVRSTPLKAMPNGIEPTTPEARAALEETVLDTYRWFRALVGERRRLEGEALALVTDGRVFTGRQAITLRLVDALGGEQEAIAWLETEKGLPKGLRVRAYAPDDSLRRLSGFRALLGLLGFEAEAAGLGAAARAALGADALDGLVSVWHPARQ